MTKDKGGYRFYEGRENLRLETSEEAIQQDDYGAAILGASCSPWQVFLGHKRGGVVAPGMFCESPRPGIVADAMAAGYSWDGQSLTYQGRLRSRLGANGNLAVLVETDAGFEILPLMAAQRYFEVTTEGMKMTFSGALTALKEGARVTRAAWSDSGEYLTSLYGGIDVEDPAAGVRPYAASQDDLKADDWMLAEPADG